MAQGERHNDVNVEGLWGRPETAEFLKVSEYTVKRLTLAGELPFVRVGKQVRYRPATIREWASKSEETAPSEGVA